MPRTFTYRENRASDAARALRIALLRALEMSGNEFGLPEIAGTDKHGTLRVELYLSPEHAADLAQLIARAGSSPPEDRAAVARLTAPECLASMGCLCAGHARGASPLDRCDTTEQPTEGR